jgi:hypothetical protein
MLGRLEICFVGHLLIATASFGSAKSAKQREISLCYKLLKYEMI